MADFLDDATIIAHESGGNPYIGWRNTDLTPYLQAGKVTPQGFPDWPGLPGPAGTSTAAGLYGITKTNWNHYAPGLGVTDFTPESQKKVKDAIMADQGPNAWLPYWSKYRSADKGLQSEGYYGGATHLNVGGSEGPGQSGTGGDLAAFALLDNLITKQRYAADAEPPQSGNDLLNLLVAGAQTRQEGPKPQEASQEPKPLTPPPAPAPDPGNAFSSYVEPPSKDTAPPAPAMPSFPQGEAATPPVPPDTGLKVQGDVPLGALTPPTPPPEEPTKPPQSGTELLSQLAGGAGMFPEPGQFPIPIGRPNLAAALGMKPVDEQIVEQGERETELRQKGASLLQQLTLASESPFAGAFQPGIIGMARGVRTPGGPGRVEPPLLSETPTGGGSPARAAGGIAEATPSVSETQAPATAAGSGFGPPTGTLNPTAGSGVNQNLPAITNVKPNSSWDWLKDFFTTPAARAARSAYHADKAAAVAPLREVSGLARREKARARAQLDQQSREVYPHIPDFERYIAEVHAGKTAVQSSEIMEMIDHIEGRGTLPAGSPLRDVAEAIRGIYKDTRAAIEREIPDMASFYEDYYRHLWRETKPDIFGREKSPVGRQGSGASLKKRSIPTIADGIRQGLTPVYLDPIENTLRYVSGMQDYLAMHRAFNIGRDGSYIKYALPGAQPEGWQQIKGRWTEVSPPPLSGVQHAYAPPGYAAAWNAYFGQGMRATPLGAKAYDILLGAKNAINAASLSMSAFHALAMSQEAQASGLARAIGDISEAEFAEAAKMLGLSGVPYGKVLPDVLGKGKRLEQQYLDMADFGPEMRQIAELYARAGGRAAGRGAEWGGTERGNYISAWRRGTLAMETREAGRRIGDGVPAAMPLRMAKELGTAVARINETITAPLFDTMIPRLKNAAFADEMGSWLKANPGATEAEQLAAARHFVDLMDDRFGEMIMDNIFWPRAVKQGLQMISVSMGWELGTLRTMGYGARDLATLNFSPRVRYLIGLGLSIGLTNAAYQYLKTGKIPGQDIGGLLSSGGAMDLMLPRTGGKTPEGAYERALLPGYEKDFIGYYHDPLGEFSGKLAGFPRLGVEALTGRDYFGREIAPYAKGTPQWFKSWGAHVLEAMKPIPFKQDTLKGSNISTLEKFMGIRQAPERLQNPERTDRMETSHRLKTLRDTIFGLTSHAARTEGERKAAEQHVKDINKDMKQIQKEYIDRQRERRGGRRIYFPEKEARP